METINTIGTVWVLSGAICGFYVGWRLNMTVELYFTPILGAIVALVIWLIATLAVPFFMGVSWV